MHRYGAYTVIDGGKSQTYMPKYLTDIQLSYGLGEYGRIKIGANNLFNVTPDENHIGQSRGGKIVDPWEISWLIRRVCSPIRGVLRRLALMVGCIISAGNRRFNPFITGLSRPADDL